MILDEVHSMVSTTFYKIFDTVKYKIILGLTGTINRLDGKEELLFSKCPIIDKIDLNEAIKNNWVSKYKEYKVLIETNDMHLYEEYNKNFLNFFSKFNYDFNLAMKCVTGIRQGAKLIKSPHDVQLEYAKSLCNLPITHPLYGQTVNNILTEVKGSAYGWNKAMRDRKSYVMDHMKKVDIANLILDHRKDKKAITFSSTIKMAEKINTGFILHSGKTKKKRQLTKDEFDKLEIGVLNTSKAMDVGE